MKLFDDARRRCEERLVTLSRDLQGCNVKIETAHRLGTPYEEIIKIARERGVDLIIIATHGYTRLEHFLLGRYHGTGRQGFALSSVGCTPGRAGLRFIKEVRRALGKKSKPCRRLALATPNGAIKLPVILLETWLASEPSSSRIAYALSL